MNDEILKRIADSLERIAVCMETVSYTHLRAHETEL
jgi:hypothetical protein